jgi:hypothetical protein
MEPYVQNRTLDLSAQSGDPWALLRQSGQASQGVSQSAQGLDPQALLLGVMNLLRSQQSGYAGQEFAARGAQAQRGLSGLPQSLIGANPSIQNSYINANKSALNPTIQGAQDSQQTIQGQLGQIKDTLQLYETSQQKASDDARQAVLNTASTGGATALQGLMQANPKIFKTAGLDAETLILGAKSKEAEINESRNLKQQIDMMRLSGGSDDGSGYNIKQKAALTKLNDSISKYTVFQSTTGMRQFADGVSVALSARNGLADIAAINQFQKVIDEGAVTRDQDVKLTQGAQSLLATLKLKLKKLERGDQLSESQRQQMLTLVNQMYQARINAVQKDPYISAKKREAQIAGIDVADTILGELGSFTTPQAGGMIKMTGPKGTFNVPADKVEVFRQNGYN